ncbi:hypothetical protein GCM10010193_63680 [Kitasatospora atroaurantiaca]|uniref:Acyl carrier protein n=1 Tax=Kitasatospora atroaurantiaca TaxID=285545 RepID=A0A561EU31_9ACTN|nr:acyl carrier protein [Kitasatospora atroaurantiaca]TWE19123.1 acyl carrier protein [Kitasatospora atroaurantiaca]
MSATEKRIDMRIAEHIVEILVEKYEIPTETLELTAEFETMELDSLVLVELAVILQKHYGVSVDDWEIEAAKTIENTVAMLHDKGVPAPASAAV